MSSHVETHAPSSPLTPGCSALKALQLQEPHGSGEIFSTDDTNIFLKPPQPLRVIRSGLVPRIIRFIYNPARVMLNLRIRWDMVAWVGWGHGGEDPAPKVVGKEAVEVRAHGHVAS